MEILYFYYKMGQMPIRNPIQRLKTNKFQKQPTNNNSYRGKMVPHSCVLLICPGEYSAMDFQSCENRPYRRTCLFAPHNQTLATQNGHFCLNISVCFRTLNTLAFYLDRSTVTGCRSLSILL